MNSFIEDAEYVDVRTIAESIREAGAVLDDMDADKDGREEAYEALREYSKTYAEIAYPVEDVTDWEDLAAAWEKIGYERDTTLIRADKFEDYVMELATDIGAIDPEQASWIVIDWARTADNVRMDYSEYDLAGTKYLLRD